MEKYQLLQIVASLLVCIGAFIFGIVLGWSASAVPKLLQNSQINRSSIEVAWIVSLMPLGAAISCSTAGIVRNSFGTKIMIAIFSIPSILGWILLIFGKNVEMIIIGRFFCGFAGGYTFMAPVYVGEISSKEFRGRLTSLSEINVKLGVLFVYVLGSFFTLWTTNIVCGLISVLYLVLCNFLPESPVFLIRKEKVDDAREILKFFRRNDEKIEEELYELQAMNHEEQHKTILCELKDNATQKAFFIIIVLFILFQTCGVETIMPYSVQILIQSGMNLNPFKGSVLLAFIQILAVLFALILVDHKGRKFLLLVSFAVMTMGLLMIAVVFNLEFNQISTLNFAWIPFVGMVVLLIGFNAGLSTVVFVLMVEIFSTSAKRFVAPLALTSTYLMSFILIFVFPPISVNHGMHLMFYFFAFSCILGFFFTWKFIPETKGKSLREIQGILGRKTLK